MRAVKLAELLSARLVAAELAATTKAGALDELAQRRSELAQRVNDLAGGGAGRGLGLPGRILEERILHVLLERERLGSTGLGHGVALPHGRLPGLEGFLLGLDRSRPGVDFDADDGEPAHLVALLVSPEGTTRHLLALAGLARLLRDAAVRDRLLSAASAEAMEDVLLAALAEV